MIVQTTRPSSRGRDRQKTVAALVFGAALAAHAASASAIDIGPGFTGAWYDPQQSGHGLFLEVLPPNNLLAWWFTFTPDGTQQAWFGGVGTFAGNTAIVPANLTTGGRWIPNFDPTKIVNNPWGTLTFTFTDCNTGQVDFTSTYPGYGSNHMALTRLTMPAGLSCGATPATTAVGSGFTGAWYDPQQSGHGLFLEALPPNNLLAWWFTFTPDGMQQAWFGGVGTFAGNTATVPANLTTGGRWIPNFDPTKIVNNAWGTLTFTFTDCNTGQVDFTSTYPGYGSNHMALTRLTMPAGLTCSPASGGATSAKGIWSGTTNFNETVRAIVLDDGTYYILYSKPNTNIDAGVVQGSANAVNGNFSSSNGVDFPIAQAQETDDVQFPATVGGTYVPGGTLQLTIADAFRTRTLTATYVAGSEQPPSLPAAAGTYSGKTVHIDGYRLATFTLGADGALSGANDVCGFQGTVTPRSSIGVFDWTVSSLGASCIFGKGPISGVLYYDEANRQIHGFAPYKSRSDQFVLLGTK